jgi:hypothetical protein
MSAQRYPFKLKSKDGMRRVSMLARFREEEMTKEGMGRLEAEDVCWLWDRDLLRTASKAVPFVFAITETGLATLLGVLAKIDDEGSEPVDELAA